MRGRRKRKERRGGKESHNIPAVLACFHLRGHDISLVSVYKETNATRQRVRGGKERKIKDEVRGREGEVKKEDATSIRNVQDNKRIANKSSLYKKNKKTKQKVNLHTLTLPSRPSFNPHRACKSDL